MEPQKLFFTLYLPVLLILPLINGYHIDSSCRDMGVESLVRDGMTSAFEMAIAARNRLIQTPLDRHTIHLLSSLFAKDGVDPAQLQQQRKFEKTFQVFQGIVGNMPTEKARENLDEEDVIIFCNSNRFEAIPEQKDLYRDTSNGMTVKYNDQQCRGSFLDHIALAVTTNPSLRQIDQNSRDRAIPTQIQICPWFIDWLKNKEFKLHRDVRRTNLGRLVIKRADAGLLRFGLRQIDAFSLLDKVLLHEMTHARGAWKEFDQFGGIKEAGLGDVPDPESIWRFITDMPAYGWTRAVSLARKGEDLGGKKAPDHNADTLALFGSVCKLLDDENFPRTVDKDGRIIQRD